MTASGAITVAFWTALVGASTIKIAQVWREEKAWREDQERCARMLAMAEIAGSQPFREEDIAMAEAVAGEWRPLDELDRLEAEERETAAYFGSLAGTADDIAHLEFFYETDWVR